MKDTKLRKSAAAYKAFTSNNSLEYEIASRNGERPAIGGVEIPCDTFNPISSSPVETPESETEVVETQDSDPVLDWFESKKSSRYNRNDVRVSKTPENAVKLDNTKHRYSIEAKQLFKYAALKSGGYAKQLFGNAAFAPEFVKDALNV